MKTYRIQMLVIDPRKSPTSIQQTLDVSDINLHTALIQARKIIEDKGAKVKSFTGFYDIASLNREPDTDD